MIQLTQSCGFVRVLVFILRLGSTSHGGIKRCDLCTHPIIFSMLGLPSRQFIEPNAMRHWLPPEIIKRMNWLNFNPPTASLQCLPNKLWIIARHYNVLVTVLDISIFKRNLWFLFLSIDGISVQISWRFLWLQLFNKTLRNSNRALTALHQEFASILQ